MLDTDAEVEHLLWPAPCCSFQRQHNLSRGESVVINVLGRRGSESFRDCMDCASPREKLMQSDHVIFAKVSGELQSKGHRLPFRP